MAEFTSLNGYDVKDKKAVRTYGSFANMQADSSLVNGQIVSTAGYYKENDGGGAKYLITTVQPSDGYYEEISTGIYATLIIENQINFKQLGAKRYGEDSTFDNKQIIDKYISICNAYDQTFELFIPGGKWCFSATLINRPKGVRIVGDKTWAYDNVSGSAILPLNDNQQYVWKLGGLQDYTDYVTSISVGEMVHTSYIDGLWFSTMNGAYDTRYSVSQGVFIIDRCSFCTFDNLFLWKFSGNGLVITSSWELDFGLVSIRQHQNPLTYSIVFDETKPVGTVSVNISALTINNLYFERNDNYIISRPGSGFSHNYINHINIELKFTSIDNTWNPITASAETLESATPIDIFRGFCRYFMIGTMNISYNDPDIGITYNGTNYYMRSILCDNYSLIDGISSRDRQFNIDVSNLCVHYGESNSVMSIIYSINMYQISHIHIGTLSCEDYEPKVLINAYQSGNIRIGSYCSQSNAFNQSDYPLNYVPAYKHALTGNSHGEVTYMADAPSEYHLVSYKDVESGPVGIRFIYYGISDSVNTQKLKILCKNMQEQATTFKVRFVQNNADNDYTSSSLPADGAWHIIEMSVWGDYGSEVRFLDYGGIAYAGFKIEE